MTDVLKIAEGCWVQTHSGGAVDLIHPLPEQIETQDLIVSLPRLARFNGHTVEMFSVAQHSVLVLKIADERAASRGGYLTPAQRLAVLLHDAHEAYIGDIVTPVMQALGWTGDGLASMKIRLQGAIHARFLLPSMTGPTAEIEEADAIALATEKRDLMAKEPAPWGLEAEPWRGSVLDLGTRYHLAASFAPLLRGLALEVAALRGAV